MNAAINFKSTTSISQFQSITNNPADIGGVLKQHLPPLDPKGNLVETPAAANQSTNKKRFIKNGFTTASQDPHQTSSFIESAQRIGGGNQINVKRIVPTTLDYD